MENGVFLWNHWSVDRLPTAYFNCGLADLVFSWGKLNDGFFNSHDFSYKYLLRTGRVAGDATNRDVEKEANEIRDTFCSSVTFVITIFDSSYGKEGHQSTDSMKYFYKQLLSSVSEKKHWGVVIKPKGRFFEGLTSDDITHEIFDELRLQQRCIYLNNKSLVSLAALIGDVSVCYGINTAGILAAMCKKQALHWDLQGLLEHPLYYSGGEDNIIFKSFDMILNALEQIEKGNTDIGDHRKWLYLFNEFQDEQGNQRAGEVIGEYMNLLENGFDHNSALDKVVENFGIKWGKDKVSKPDAIQEHLGNDLWFQVIEKVSSHI
jgi:hypothetical protein